MQTAKKMGRPRVADYRKIKHRMSKIEDTFLETIEKLESEKDKKEIKKALEKLKKIGVK